MFRRPYPTPSPALPPRTRASASTRWLLSSRRWKAVCQSPSATTTLRLRAWLSRTRMSPNPYQGLLAFDDADADRFFGRERLVSELVSRFSGDGVSSRSVIVVGPSGSGKSSVVLAGLLPAIRAGDAPGSADWFVTTMVPGSDPYEALEAALLRIAVNPPPSLIEQLRSGSRGILRSVRRCLGACVGNSQRAGVAHARISHAHQDLPHLRPGHPAADAAEHP